VSVGDKFSTVDAVRLVDKMFIITFVEFMPWLMRAKSKAFEERKPDDFGYPLLAGSVKIYLSLTIRFDVL